VVAVDPGGPGGGGAPMVHPAQWLIRPLASLGGGGDGDDDDDDDYDESIVL